MPSTPAAPPAQQPLAGRVALVTGASGGIGQAISRALATRGALVAAAYGSNGSAARTLCEELRAAGARAAQPFASDMEDPAGPARLVHAVEEALGPVEILVANHGRGRAARYEELDAAEFDRTLAVNLRAPFLLAQAALRGMRERRFGRVLFVSSTAAFRGGALAPDYSASKAGLHGLAHFLASRVAKDGVTVNAVAPGFVETAMLPGDPAELGARVPVGRVGHPQEVAEIVCAVLANGYITSHVVSVDGGMHPR
jgi:3-oxoacyl-[acyl-carrier protein] reductase